MLGSAKPGLRRLLENEVSELATGGALFAIAWHPMTEILKLQGGSRMKRLPALSVIEGARFAAQGWETKGRFNFAFDEAL